MLKLNFKVKLCGEYLRFNVKFKGYILRIRPNVMR
jgi:hypothetical protein